MMAWLRQYAPTYREMKPQDLRLVAENWLGLPLRRAEDQKRLEMQERLSQAAVAAKAAKEKELTW